MPKKIEPLGAVDVKRLDGRGLHAVGGVAGLYLQIAKGGSRSWILRATVGSKRRDIGLGGFPDVPLAEAREKARAARSKIAEGVDVVMERQSARQALITAQAKRLTFKEAAARKHAAIVHQFRNLKHRQDWISSLERCAFPIIGAMDVSEIQTAHVLAVLKPIWETRTETASRVRARIEAVLSWATVAKYRTGENPARWAGNLSELLPKPSKIQTRAHLAALPWQKVPELMAELRQREGTSARALEFAILTAARSGEVRGMAWDEIDAQRGVWTVPAERMKAKKPHDVPLSPRALEIARAQPRLEGSPYVFAAPRGGMLSDMTLSMFLRRMRPGVTVHGTARSGFKDWARNRTRYADEVSELCLAHVNSDATRAAYARDGLLSQRAALLREWAEFCSHPFTESADVVSIGERRA